MDVTTGAAAGAMPAPDPTDAAGPRLSQPLRQRDFRLVFAGESVSLLGDQFHFVALAWLTLQLTGSGLALGTVLTAAAIPRAVFVLVGGALSDRVSPRTLMLVSNAIRSLVVAVVAVLVISGNAQLWQLYILAVIFGIVDAFFYPAMNTIVPMLVSERLLPPANALIQGVQQLAGLIGPALAGLVVAAVQTGPAFAVDAASFAVAAVAVALVRGGRRTPTHEAGEGDGFVGSIGSGVRYALGDPAVRSLLVLIAAFNFAFTGPMSVGIPYLADARFGGDAATLGLLLAVFGAGAVGGAVLAGSIGAVRRLGTVTLAIAGMLGIGLIGIGLAEHVLVAMAIGAAMGIGIGFINVRVVAWLQARTPEEMRGRVMSLVMLGSIGLAPISLAVSGALIDFGAVSVMYAVAGGIVIAAVAAGVAWGVPARMNDGPTV